MSGKTSVTILQEFMVKRGLQPLLECIESGGPPHDPVFKYRATALDVSVVTFGRSKKEAKQESARLLLQRLADLGILDEQSLGPQAPVAQPITGPSPTRSTVDASEIPLYNNVATLKDLCFQYTMPVPEYTVIDDIGPAHAKQFTVECRVGSQTALGISTTKRQARQLAASKVYAYLSKNLDTYITHLSEEHKDLVLLSEKASQKYLEEHNELPWKPNLGQKLCEYHLGFKEYIDETKRNNAIEIMNEVGGTARRSEVIEMILNALGLEFEWEEMELGVGKVQTLTIPHCYPMAVIAAFEGCGDARESTATEAFLYLETMLK